MTRRIRNWLGETHSLGFEMMRHFAVRLFDSEMFSEQGQWAKVGIGVVSGLIPLAILVLPMFWHRYGCVNLGQPSFDCPAIADYRAQYAKLVQYDVAWIIGLAMCATAIATAVEWQALFPARRDRLALASLPVNARDMFAAKFSAVAVVFVGFVLAMNTVPSVLFAAVIQGRWLENQSFLVNVGAILAATSGASAFVFFGLLAFQGVLLNVLPVRLFSRITVYLQAAVFTLGLAALPFLWPEPGTAVWLPLSWFLDLRAAVVGVPGASARSALLATGLAAALALIGYLVSCARYEKWMLESPASAARSHRLAGLGSRLLERWIGDPREQAMFAFMAKTLSRSRIHRLVLLLYAGLGIVWMAKGIAEHLGESHADSTGFEFATAFLPLTAVVFGLLALRYLFSLPSELPANWVFRITEAEGRGAWLLAVERFVIWCALVPAYACGAPAAAAVLGPVRAFRVSALGFAMGLLFFETLFRNWRKAPFTCSYQPGKRPAWLIVAFGFVSLSYVAAASGLALALSRNLVAFVASLPILLTVWWRMRKRRQAWSEAPLIYEDLPEPAVRPLHIEYERNLQPPSGTSEVHPAPGFWNSLRAPEETLDREIAPWFAWGGIWEDVRYALRGIRKNFSLSSAVVATLALGIGMNVAVFTLIDGSLFRARVPKPETFVRVSPVHGGQALVTDTEYGAYREGSGSLAALAAWRPEGVTLGRDHSFASKVLMVSCNFMSVYRLDRPLLGRLLLPGDCESTGQPVAVLSEEAWRRRFGADPELVGKTIRIDDEAFTVVGIAPARCAARIDGAEAWLPYSAELRIEPNFDVSRGWLTLEGRLAHGLSRAAAQAELRVIASHLDRMEPGRKTTLTVNDGSWISVFGAGRGGRKPAQWLVAAVLAALGMVLLLACINVTTLLLSRAVSRRREIAVRLALGAPRARLARMLFIESFVLTAAAGCAGLYIAHIAPEPLYRLLANTPPDFSLTPDWGVLLYVLGLVLFAACLSGLTPALESLRVDLASALKGYAATTGGLVAGSRLRGILVSSQTAMSLALLVAAGLFGRAFFQMYFTDPGLETHQVLVVPLRFPHADKNTAASMLRAFADRVRSLPGMRSVAYTNRVPLEGGRSADAIAPALDSLLTLDLTSASPGYFETLGIPILRGRAFRESDPPAGRLSAQAVVSESIARTMWPGQEPIGRRLPMTSGPALEVIGVARDVENPTSDLPLAYVLEETWPGGGYLLVRCEGDPRVAAKAIRELNPDYIVTAKPLQSLIDERISVNLRIGSFVWTIGMVACLLAMAGIYGVVSFEVSLRKREIGIRAALGAQRRDILREVLLSGGKPVVAGLCIGLWLSLAAGAILNHEVSGAPANIDSANAAVYLGTALLLAFAAVGAMLISARRNSRIDPIEALRSQ